MNTVIRTNPFLAGVHTVLRTALHITAREQERDRDCGPEEAPAIVAVVELLGPIVGAVALRFPAATAVNLVNHWIGLNLVQVNDVVRDGIGELMNMVSGSSKAILAEELELDSPVRVRLPVVVEEAQWNATYAGRYPWIKTGFESAAGCFSLYVSLNLSPIGRGIRV